VQIIEANGQWSVIFLKVKEFPKTLMDNALPN